MRTSPPTPALPQLVDVSSELREALGNRKRLEIELAALQAEERELFLRLERGNATPAKAPEKVIAEALAAGATLEAARATLSPAAVSDQERLAEVRRALASYKHALDLAGVAVDRATAEAAKTLYAEVGDRHTAAVEKFAAALVVAVEAALELERIERELWLRHSEWPYPKPPVDALSALDRPDREAYALPQRLLNACKRVVADIEIPAWHRGKRA